MAHDALPGATEVFFPKALVNAFIADADVPTLIGTGTSGGAAKLLGALRRAGHAPGDLGRIILTHRHTDHGGNAAELARLTGATVHVSPTDAASISARREQPRPRVATPLGHALIPYVKAALPWTLDPLPVEETLVDGVRIGPFLAVATPGHTAGHVPLLWEERGVLFTGDAAANITRVGPHPASDNPELARESFRQLHPLQPEAACFGHGRTLRRDAGARLQR